MRTQILLRISSRSLAKTQMRKYEKQNKYAKNTNTKNRLKGLKGYMHTHTHT